MRVFALLLAILPGVAGAFEPRSPLAVLPENQGAEPVPSSTAPASVGLAQREIRAHLSPRNYTTLSSELALKIKRLPVSEDHAFREGQLLIAFDCALQIAQLNRSKASLQASQRTWSANQRLAELNSIGQVELAVSEAEVKKNQADLAAMQALLEKCSINAPFPGRIAEQKVREQMFVQPGQPLLEIIDDSVLELEFIVPSRWLSWLKQDYRFEISIDETGKAYPARVTRLGARIDPVSQSIKLTAAIEGRFPELLSGMSGRVSLSPPAQP